CAIWAWVCTVAVVVEALASPVPAARAAPGVPAVLRRLVLGACGVALSATAGPALATAGVDPQHGPPVVVAGLPFPARAMDLPAEAHRVVVVRPGDSLWAITAGHLPPDANDVAITAAWHELYTQNRVVVGDDPSLIHPGQQLVLPDHLEEPS
ncbi:LysM peptidoglycan-binding domain-containing protein, partial [Nocardioides sp. CER28]